MRWALDSEGQRLNALNYKQPKFIKKELRTPCCNQPAIFIPSYRSSHCPYFRHQNLSKCPYATAPEYNMELHWNIVDDLDDNIQEFLFRFRIIYRNKILGLCSEILIGLKLRKIKTWREYMFEDKEYPECRRRTDLLSFRTCFEIQCSPIPLGEVKIRELTYRKNRCGCSWILGFNDHVKDHFAITYPFEAKTSVRQESQKYYRKHRKRVKKISDRRFEVKGLVLKKWQVELLNSNRVTGIYYRDRFYHKFKVETVYTHVPRMKFTPAFRKILFLRIWT